MRALVMCLGLCLVLAGCARDSEEDLRKRLAGWFRLGETVYFKSTRQCTAASFDLTEIEPFPALVVQRNPDAAKEAFVSNPVAAIRMPRFSPHDVADAMLMSGDGTFGKEALRAAARSVACLEGSLTDGYLHVALMRQGALLAFDRETEGLMVLDPLQERLFYVAGAI